MNKYFMKLQEYACACIKLKIINVRIKLFTVRIPIIYIRYISDRLSFGKTVKTEIYI